MVWIPLFVLLICRITAYTIRRDWKNKNEKMSKIAVTVENKLIVQKTMFRPLGSFIPTAVLTDIGLFFDKDQLHQFSLASPTANAVFESYRMMDYKRVEICALGNNKISIVLQGIDNTRRNIYIDKEDLTEKMAIILSTCRSINYFLWHGDLYTEWDYFMFNEKLMELMLKMKIKEMFLRCCSISVTLPLFLKFLYRHGNILTLCDVRLPSELVSNKTLKLINYADILRRPDSDLVVDVTDELLEGANPRFTIKGFIAKFTIKGISAFVKKHGYCCITDFGVLASNQLQDGCNFVADQPHGRHSVSLTSMNGQKSLRFYVKLRLEMYPKAAGFSIKLNMTETDQYGMVPIPHNTVGIVAQEAFVKFDKICDNPEESLPISQYQMKTMQFTYNTNLSIRYTIRGENRILDSNAKSDVTLKDAKKMIAAILGNCTSIEKLVLYGINLDEDLYHLLKAIAHNIDVTTEWRIQSALDQESLREVQAANTGLFGKVILQFPTRN